MVEKKGSLAAALFSIVLPTAQGADAAYLPVL
jgi:hypothetical protein